MSKTTSLFILFLLSHSLSTSILTASSSDILYDINPFIRVYKNGTIQRFIGTDIVPPSIDAKTGVQSKDIIINPQLNITARLYVPKDANPSFKIPLLVYFHGDGFFTESASSPSHHNHLNSVLAEANVVAVSVNYRLAPEYPLPIGYQDSWLALKWVFSCDEPWIKNYVAFGRVYVGGDSVGANIAHNMAVRVGLDETGGVLLNGLFLNCLHFWGKMPIGNEDSDSNIQVKNMMESIWIHAYPNLTGLDDPLLNPGLDPNLSRLGSKKVLVYVAGNDILNGRGWYYKEALSNSKWSGVVKIVQAQGEEHDFGVRFPNTPNAIELVKNFASFLNEGQV
ncbi:Arylacetamide deacetylase [Handroanthus impetiginosus]|uniref:Arylacetamide deacetylase n=1 Tax=Handroanthus impetiginosus TaxID=429701 RepID=A0A2G9HCQ7_9LAMI|nr:Arylacetamide deacetylase [Handroanthus impetiginosus]